MNFMKEHGGIGLCIIDNIDRNKTSLIISKRFRVPAIKKIPPTYFDYILQI